MAMKKHGNKEAKKPKKVKPLTNPETSIVLAQGARALEPAKKRK